MTFYQQIILAIISGSMVSGIMTIILARMNRKWAKEDKKDEKMEAIIDCLSVLMEASIRNIGQEYVQKKEITLEEKEGIEKMYRIYARLQAEESEDNNLETIMQEVRKLRMTSSRSRI